MIGNTVSHYRVVSKIGAGGMGVVYKAEDTRLGRSVALKFIPEDWLRDPIVLERFKREARAASALNHPNICTLFDIGEGESGPFLVMEYLEGDTLEQLLRDSILPPDELLDIAIQLADALDIAHQSGVVHRDIKPANIILTPRGQAKVMDFGLAKVAEANPVAGSTPVDDGRTIDMHPGLTNPGSAMGTIAYMSPEQARGEVLDLRTDLFSLGVVIYQMATNTPPFQGATTALTYDAILNRDPAPPLELRPQLPPGLQPIIQKALEKNRDLRYQTASDMRSDLKRLKRDIGRDVSLPPVNAPVAPARAPSSAEYIIQSLKRNRRRTIAAAGIAVLAAAGALYLAMRDRPLDTLAVLPFTNISGDPNTEYLSDGITESVINSLSQVPKLNVRSFTSVVRFKGKNLDPQEVAGPLKVRAIVTGRLIRQGDNISVSAELVDARTDRQIWGDQYHRPMTDLVGIEEQISRQISEKLRVRLTGVEMQKIAHHATDNPEAYSLYLQGRFSWNKRTLDGMQQSIDFFQQAIGKDPRYALAHAGLADAYALLASSSVLPAKEIAPRVKSSAARALELDDSLAEARASLGWGKFVGDWDWTGAEREFRRAIELNPNYPTAHAWLGELLMARGRFDESLQSMNRAHNLEPTSSVLGTALGYRAYYAGDYAEAIEQCRRVLAADPNFIPAHVYLGRAYEQKGAYTDATAEFKKALALSEGDSNELAALGHIYAVSGKAAEARKIADQLKERSKQTYVQPIWIALIHAALGEKDEAFDWLEKAYADRSVWLVYLKIDPMFNPLREDPRFAGLLHRVQI